ncbi:hypothetical protein BH11PLA2_BH11PLA2_37580 [soil metagenome]
MRRIGFPVLFVVAAVLNSGCANTWDTFTSRKFRQKPFGTMFSSEDPLTVMKSSVEGDERAYAMRKLKEPNQHGKTSEDQDEAIKLLSAAAISDPSPVVRVAAIDALGRFQDERAIAILNAAYRTADGVPSGVEKPKKAKSPVNSDEPEALAERYSLRGPIGFADEVTSAIRSRTIDSLANTGKATALPVLAEAAQGGSKDLPVDRDTQLTALRGLQRIRTKESAGVLMAVLKEQKGKDPAMTDRAHDGLVALTGQKMPADASVWEAAMKSGEATVKPESSGIVQVGAIFSK